jgi:hypothetical protein
MSDQESARDERLAELLADALATLRQTGKLDVAAWQTHHPDLADDLPALLDTLHNLDTAVDDWKALAQPATLSVPGQTTGAAGRPLPRAIGRYEVLEVIGEGGMGTVYKAHDPQLRRLVAIKVPHFAGPQTARAVAMQRFLREAHAAAGVRHPHVCPIHDVGEHYGMPFVVMDYVEGQSLAGRLAAGHYEDCRAAVTVVRQVADALDAVHARGLIHRDLKPGNILLDTGGRALLADFGLARPLQTAEALTMAGELVGTPAYMAPEQVTPDAGSVGPSSDVYSLGVVLYQMLCGRLPFHGSVEGVLYQIARTPPPPPSHFREGLDPALEKILLRMLSRQPEARFRTARELVEALDRWLAGQPVAVAEPPTTAEPAPAAVGSPTVIRADLPEGGSVAVTLQPGAAPPEKLNVTVREQTGKRRKRRLVTISITVAFSLLLMIAGIISLSGNGRPLPNAYQGKDVDPVAEQLQREGASVPGGVLEHDKEQRAVAEERQRREAARTTILAMEEALRKAKEARLVLEQSLRKAEEQRLVAEARQRAEERQWQEAVRMASGTPLAYNGLAPGPEPSGTLGAYSYKPHLVTIGSKVSSKPDPVRVTSPYNRYSTADYAGHGYGAPGAWPTLTSVFPSAVTLPSYATPSGGGYGNPPYSDPSAGYLRGTADVVNAGGSLAIRLEQSRLINQQVVAAKLENHRRIWDQWLYERYNMPTLQDERERTLALATRRALTEPPTTEILSATTLNQLLRSLKGKTNGQPIPLDENVLKQINVTVPAGGNLGVLKPARDGNTLNWPQGLKDQAYQVDVKQVNELAVALVKEAEGKGQVDAVRLQNLTPVIARLKTRLNENQHELTVVQIIEAKRFLNQLDGARQALGNPRAAELLTGKLAPQGKTVAELVQNMVKAGLEFAPATDGDEAAYVALYNSLLAYTQSIGPGSPPQGP